MRNNNDNKMKRGIIITLMSFILLAQIIFISADGGYFPPPGHYVTPGQQKAVIFYEDNIETLIVTSEFRGNAKDLVWIIPTPTKPEVTKADKVIFQKFDDLTKPQVEKSSSPMNIMSMAKEDYSFGGVYIYESKQVDYYDVNILYATNSQDLIKWFNENNYQYPVNESNVLQGYIDKNWFFTVIKVSTEALGSSNAEYDIKQGAPTPVKMVFRTEGDVVFPLKISSIDFSDNKNYRRNNVPIHIFMIGQGKYETPNNYFELEYGNWFEKKELEKALKDDTGKVLIDLSKNKYFVTRFYANMQKNEMDSDVYFNYADNNKKVNTGPGNAEIFFKSLMLWAIILLGILLSPVGWILIAGSLMIFLSKNNTVRIFGWIIESFMLGLLIFLSLITIFKGTPLAIYGAFLFLIIAILVLMFIQKKYKK